MPTSPFEEGAIVISDANPFGTAATPSVQSLDKESGESDADDDGGPPGRDKSDDSIWVLISDSFSGKHASNDV
jgi:hypothetical protein